MSLIGLLAKAFGVLQMGSILYIYHSSTGKGRKLRVDSMAGKGCSCPVESRAVGELENIKKSGRSPEILGSLEFERFHLQLGSPCVHLNY